jgi:hypothetical protein
MSAIPVIPTIPTNADDPAWLQAAIAALNAEITAGDVSLATLIAQILALGARAASLL